MINLKDGMNCPICDKGKLTKTIIEEYPYQYGIFPMRHKTTFENVTIYKCNICDDGFYDKETTDRINLWVEECREYESNF